MSGHSSSPWRLWIDTGGTFTDCCGLDPNGHAHRLKILSSSSLRARLLERLDGRSARFDLAAGLCEVLRGARCCRLHGSAEAGSVATVESGDAGFVTVDRPLFAENDVGATFELRSAEEAPVLAARVLTGTPPGAEFPPLETRLATTRGTNALLERAGAATALVVTKGFRDLLAIGTQARSDLFALDIRKPEPLHRTVVEADERLGAGGEVLRPLANLGELVTAVQESGCRSVAVALLHAYRNPVHELAIAAELAAAGVEHVSTSAEVAPLIKLLPRAQTAVVDAYLAPVVGSYLQSIRSSVRGSAPETRRLFVMSSAGGLTGADEFRAKDSLLSGPAGGVVGAATAARAAGFESVLTFDMGGTSTDVARYDGDYTYVFEQRVADATVVAPALHIETVAAGGGSICSVRGGQLKVGPQSAGAAPGPACYGAGGPLTLTDVNLLLGRLDPARFEIPIEIEAARARATAVMAEAGIVADRRDDALEGFVQIANERMAEAIRGVSVRQGYDPRTHALVTFGGAGAQHACAIAAELGIVAVLVPADASLLSAVGLGHSVLERFAQRQVLRLLAELGDGELGVLVEELCAEASRRLAAEGVTGGEIRRVIARVRFAGQEAALDVEVDRRASAGGIGEGFRARYAATFGYLPDRAIELESLRVIASAPPEGAAWLASTVETSPREKTSARRSRLFIGGRWLEVELRERSSLTREETVAGPALITERRSCTVVDPGWRARVEPDSGCLVLEQPTAGAPG